MKLTFLGAARTVTGSMHLLETARSRVLLDCGLFQGRRDEAEAINRQVPACAVAADFMILSHSHIDHSGNIPNLVKSGFRHEIYQTPACRDLCALLLLDSARIQESDLRFLNRRRERDGLAPKEPVYTTRDAEQALTHLTGLPYGRRCECGDVAFTLHDAGHILGSAQVAIEAEGMKVVFTGDLGRSNLPIIRDPEQLDSADYLIIESTYGNRVHPPFEESAQRLAEVVNRVYRQGGRIIIPAFALGRTQEIVYALHKLLDAGAIPDVPVFVDSPLAAKVSEVFRRHLECFDAESLALIRANDGTFYFERLHFITRRDESQALNSREGPCIIISASGMAESGRVLHHLRHAIGDARNVIMLVGFAAEHTLARRLAEGQEVVRILGDEYRRRARVEVIHAFSAHADQPALAACVAAFDRQRLKKVFLVHGELEQAEALQAVLRSQGVDAVIPERGQTFELTPARD